MTSVYIMFMTFNDDSSHELSTTDTGKHASEIPTPESQTEKGDVQPEPAEPPHMPGPASSENNPAHPASDRV
jgi:hypothetical protein